MPELTKTETEIEETDASKSDRTWESDQNELGYYYDDNHGYEVYRPGEDSDDSDECGEDDDDTEAI